MLVRTVCRACLLAHGRFFRALILLSQLVVVSGTRCVVLIIMLLFHTTAIVGLPGVRNSFAEFRFGWVQTADGQRGEQREHRAEWSQPGQSQMIVDDAADRRSERDADVEGHGVE